LLTAAADGSFINVDYTAAKYTKYSFSMKMMEGNTRNNNIAPHGGFKVCNFDGHSSSRGSSPEMWFIDRSSDWGYGTYNGGWGHSALYKDKSYYGDAEPADGAEKKWEVIMQWTGSSYVVYSWTIEGVDFSKYKGKNSGCKSSKGTDGFAPRVWSYPGSVFGIRNFQVFQGDDVESLTALWEGPVALKTPPGVGEDKCFLDTDE